MHRSGDLLLCFLWASVCRYRLIVLPDQDFRAVDGLFIPALDALKLIWIDSRGLLVPMDAQR